MNRNIDLVMFDWWFDEAASGLRHFYDNFWSDYPPFNVYIFAAFLLMFAFFMAMTRMHERYLFSVFTLLAMSWYVRSTIWIYVGLAATYLANLAYVMAILNDETFISDGHWTIYVLVPANIFLLGLSLWTFCNMQRAGPPGAAKLVRLLRRDLAHWNSLSEMSQVLP